MTTQESINKKNGEINDKKIFLKRTDYLAIREMEGGEPMQADIKQQRAQARADINTLEAEIIKLNAQLAEEEAAANAEHIIEEGE